MTAFSSSDSTGQQKCCSEGPPVDLILQKKGPRASVDDSHCQNIKQVRIFGGCSSAHWGSWYPPCKECLVMVGVSYEQGDRIRIQLVLTSPSEKIPSIRIRDRPSLGQVPKTTKQLGPLSLQLTQNHNIKLLGINRPIPQSQAGQLRKTISRMVGPKRNRLPNEHRPCQKGVGRPLSSKIGGVYPIVGMILLCSVHSRGNIFGLVARSAIKYVPE